ncbi:MAG: YwaF family protein [Propionibacteriaceae bacterium]|nr:YwaF family protein [Propionibacteriaceae bacterium]
MIVAPLSGAWALLVIVLAGVGLAFHYLMRKRDWSTRRKALFIFALVNLGFSITFHLTYMINPPPEGFPVFQNLPLHLCTLMSWLLPLAVWFEWRPLRAAVFFPGALAGIAALYSAAPSYWQYNLFDLHTFFWVSHGFNAVIPFLMASLQLYRPRLIDSVLSAVYIIVLALLVLPITLILRTWVDSGANYFYVFDPEGAEILELFFNWIKVPVIYEIPLLILVTPLMMGMYGIYLLLNRKHLATSEIPH